MPDGPSAGEPTDVEPTGTGGQDPAAWMAMLDELSRIVDRKLEVATITKETADELLEAAKDARDTARSARLVSGVLAFVVGVVALAAGIGIVVGRGNAEVMNEVHSVSEGNARVINEIRDCTRPGGQCYEANRAQATERQAPFITLICNATPPERREPPCR